MSKKNPKEKMTRGVKEESPTTPRVLQKNLLEEAPRTLPDNCQFPVKHHVEVSRLQQIPHHRPKLGTVFGLRSIRVIFSMNGFCWVPLHGTDPDWSPLTRSVNRLMAHLRRKALFCPLFPFPLSRRPRQSASPYRRCCSAPEETM